MTSFWPNSLHVSPSPSRMECNGALYQVTSRGGRREVIYLDGAEREDWLVVLAQVCQRFNVTPEAFDSRGAFKRR